MLKGIKSLAVVIFIGAAAAGLSSCYKHYRITIGLSKELRDYYGIYPTIEADIFAAPAGTVDQIKTAGVEKYFAPGSALRADVHPYTVRFSNEITAPVTLSYRDLPWKEWKKSKPEKLVLIVNLPLAPDQQQEERLVTLDIKQRIIQWDHAYFEIGPRRIVQVYSKPGSPQEDAENARASATKAETRAKKAQEKAEKAQAEAERAQAEAQKAQAEAEKAKAEAAAKAAE